MRTTIILKTALFLFLSAQVLAQSPDALGLHSTVAMKSQEFQSSVALVRKSNFLLPQILRLKDSYRFCNKAQFEEDLMWASCSGTKIGADLVLTAAHCLPAYNDCSDLLFVEQFITNEDIPMIQNNPKRTYSCARVIYSSAPRPSQHDKDIALLQMDRPFEERAQVQISTRWNPQSESVFAVGYPSGTPRKLSVGFSLKNEFQKENELNKNYKKIHLLAPAGLSGGGVFNEQNQLVGLVVRSNTGYIHEERCVRDISCDFTDCPTTEVQTLDKDIVNLFHL